MTKRDENQLTRNKRIREEIRKLTDSGFLMKEAIGIVAEKYYISESTVRDVVYDKRRK